jgi:hypothetical protein
VTERVLVPFAGEGSGSGALTWGQQTIWREFEGLGAPVWLTGLLPTRPGWTVEDQAGELAFVMSRNQSMRTRLRVRGDRPVKQIVYDSGEICLQVLDAADDDDPLRVAKDLEATWKVHDLAYDYANDWPVRMALVRHRGNAVYRVQAMSHIVTDGYGALAMHRDIAARDPVTGGPSGPITSMEPLEQAEWQAGPAGKRCSRMSERFWGRVLRAIPARRFDEPAGAQPGSRYGLLTLQSRAAFLAVQAIAACTGVATSPVLLAAVASGMARATGINPVVPRLYVSNRFRPRLAGTVSPIAQTCPCVIDVAGITFHEAVRRVYYASLAAYKHAYFEPSRIRELIAAASEERGEPIDLAFIYNDIRMSTPREPATSRPAPQDIQAALPSTKIGWEDRPELEGLCSIEFGDSPDTVSLLMAIDTQYIGRAQAEACLREMEAVTVAAALDPDVLTGV